MTMSDDCWKKIPSLGNVHAYISAIQEFPLLSEDEEQLCAASSKPEDKAKLVLSHLRLANGLAKKYYASLGTADAIQDANMGLLAAAERFKPNTGARFVTFASAYISAYLKQSYMMSCGPLSTSFSKPDRKMFWNLTREKSKIRNMHGRDTLNSEEVKSLAEKHEISEDTVRLMETFMYGNTRPVRLDHTFDEGEDAAIPVAVSKAITDSGADPIEQMLYAEQDYLINHFVPEFINELDEREQFIIKNRLLAEKKMSFSVMATMFDISIERCRQIEVRAIKKIREACAEFM